MLLGKQTACVSKFKKRPDFPRSEVVFVFIMEQSWLFGLLTSAKEEIKRLRAENNIMAARLDVFDKMISVFNAQKEQTGCGMAPDIVYDIEKVIAEFGTKEEVKVRDFERVNSSDKL